MAERFPLDVNAVLSVLNYLNVGVYITDLDRRILVWNRKAEQITGYRAEDVIGKACHENVLVHADKDGHELCHSGLCPLYRSMQMEKESKQPVLIYAQTASGQRVTVSVSVAPLRDASGKVIGGIEVFRDETAQIRDLEFARKIQRHLMPVALPDLRDIAFDVLYYPHDLIGGDLYDVRRLGSDHVGVLVADVSGHGVSAALYTMWLKSLEESSSDVMLEPSKFLSGLNRELTKFVVEESFATAFYAVINVKRYKMTYCNGGHPSPLHFHARGGRIEELETPGLPLGIMAEQQYDALDVDLEPGDVILLYTDGITEVADRHGEMLGREGLGTMLSEELGRPQSGLLERLYQRVKDTCGDVSLSDDVLLLSVRREK